jgi:CheY-like chemotaxis protein
MPLKILLIDDQPENVKAVIEELQTALDGAECHVTSFESAASELERVQPDVVVLDLMNNTIGGQVDEGTPIGLGVWQQRFCPLIFYTASDENVEGFQHPLVAVIRKGSGSEEQVRDKIKSYIPHIAALGRVSTEINDALRKALRESKPRVFEQQRTADEENQLLVRSIRRRVAASMDDAMVFGEPNLMSWEQYLCPPGNSEHLLTGDILRVKDANPADPSSYRVVATPSCDLVKSDQRKPKVDSVLLVRCTKVSRLLADLGMEHKADTKAKAIDQMKEKIARFLTQGYGHSSFPIAALPGEFPVMAADFRSLEIVSLDDLSNETLYERVASVDAPFRELFVWAYLSAAGRPGMPDRDFGPWADSIISELQKDFIVTEAAQ